MAAALRVAVIGLGRAGTARVRDLPTVAPATKGMQHITLAGFVSRRTIEGATAPQLSLDDVMKEGSDVDAVIICTENATHEPLARRALEAKKHVCVDFPLATNSAAAKELFELAKSQGRVLYEEDIALLTDKSEATAKLIKQKGPMVEAHCDMKFGPNGWIENMSASGSPFHSRMEVLHAQVCYFGDLTPKSCSIDVDDKGTIQSRAELTTKDNGIVVITFTIGEGIQRSKTYVYTFADGSTIDQNTPVGDLSEQNKDKPKGLFMRDVLEFAQTVSGERDSSFQQWLSIRCLEIADELFKMAKETNKAL